MKTFLRRILAPLGTALALLAAPAALATPTISFVTPTSGSTIASVVSPATVAITVNAAATAGSTITSVQFFANGTLIGTAAGTSPFTVQWTPTVAGNHTLTATVNDTSAITTGANASTNTATVNSFITITSVRTISVASSVGALTVAQDSQVFMRASAAMSDAIIGQVEFFVDGVAIPGATVTRAPYNAAVTLSAANGFATGSRSLTAVVTSADNSVTATSAAVNITVAAPVAGNAVPTVSISAPSAGASLVVNGNVTLSATANDTDGFIPSTAGGGVTFFVDGDPVTAVGSGETNPDLVAPYSITWRPTVIKNNYSLRAQTIDDKNNIVLSSAVLVNVVGSVSAPTVSLTSPTNGSTVGLNTAVSLAATASASGGATVTRVDFLLGTTVLGSATTAPYTFSWTPTSTGAAALSARVTDSNGSQATSSTVNVTVSAAVPSVSITAPTNGTVVPLGTSTTVTASASGSGSATINRVDFLAGTAVIGTALVSPYSITWTPTASGITALTARATDSNGTTATSTIVNVNVTAPSVALTAPTAGSVVTSGSVVAVTASATAGSAAITKVDFFAGAALIDTATSAPYTINWTPSTTGSVSLTARVTDANGATSTSSAVAVTVAAAAAPTVSVTAPAAGAVVTVGSNVSLSATATPGAGATVAQVQFLVGTTIVGTDTTAPYSVTWVPTTAGNFNITARVIDSNSTTVTSSIVTVTANAAASISLTAPANNSTAIVGTAIAVTASPAPSLGSFVNSVTFFANGTQIGAPVTSAPYTIAWTPTTAGAVSLTAQMLDSGGANPTSAAISVTVANSAPTISLTAPLPGAVVVAGSNVSLSATAAGGSGGATVTQVQFLAGTTVIATLPGNGTATYTSTWVPAAAGNFSLTARVTDSNGNTTTSSAVSVTATAAGAPTVSITAPITGSVVTTGSTVTVSATATPTAGATIAQVQFFVAGTTIIGTSTTAVGGSYSISWIPNSSGNFSITARVLDSTNATATSSAITVTAVTATTISLTAPVNNSTATVGVPVTVSASAAPVLGATITSVSFSATVGGVTTSLGTVNAAPYSVSWTPNATGATTLIATAVDSLGTTATSTVVNVTVNNSAPTIAITSPTPGSIVTVGTTVTITATAAATTPATVSQVQFLAGPTVIATVPGNTTGTYTASWVPANAGNFNLTARVIDSNNVTITATAIPVTATGGSSIVLTGPAAGVTLPLNTPTILSATATTISPVAVARVDYLVNGAVVGSSVQATTYDVPWTPTSAGVFTIVARLTDSTQTVVSSLPISVTVATTSGSSVSLSLSPAGSGIPVNSSRTLTATAVSAVGVAYVEFVYDGLTVIATDTTAPYSAIFTAPNELGGHTLRARAVEVNGNKVESTPATSINIIAPVGSSPLAAILAPTSGAFVAANAATTITGTATDADGAITSVQVSVNGSTAGLANGGLATVNGANWSIVWTPTASGTASIVAIAADNNGNATAAPAVGVNVTDNTSPAITLLLSPRTVAAAASTTLPSGAVRNFVADVIPSPGRAVARVEFFVDGTKLGEDTTLPYTFRFVAPALGTGEQSHIFVLSARATDNAGSARDVQIPLLVVSPLGLPPTVSLLTPTSGTSVFPGGAVSLAATAVANGGTIASVQFYVNGNAAGINGGNAITAAPYTASFVPTAPGSYTVDAIATDDRGNTTVSNSATFTAAFATPTIVFTAPNPNATARATPNVPITLSATATVQSGAGAAILLVEFLLDGVQIGADTAFPYSFSWIPSAAQLGQHVLTARVTDTNSQTAVSNPLTVNVANVIGSPPTVSVSASPIPAVFGLQTASTVNFVATAVATGTGSTLSNAEIFLNDISIGLGAREQNTNFYRVAYDLNRFDFSTVTPVINDITGAVTYPVRLYAIARDSNNNQTVSATTNLIINPATSSPPSIQLFAATPTNITAGTQFFMLANFTDLDGVVTSIQLFANGTPVQTFGNPQQGQFLTYNAANAGRFNLYAVATDDTGNTAVSSPSIVVNVTAVSAPNTTITRPTNDATTATVGSPVFLEGTAVNTATTQVPTMQFVATAGGGSRQIINGIRVGTTTTYRAIWTPINPDTYTVSTQSSVGVVQGTSSASRRVVVTEIRGLQPTITLTRATGVSGVPGSATTATVSDLCATATDPDGSVVEVEFFVNRNSVGQARKDPQGNTWRLTASFAGLLPGATEIVALARDSSGNIVASPTSTINVTAASSIAPSITITPSNVNPAFNRQVQLRSNARDSDGTVSSVQYFANATSIATSTNSGSLFLSNWTPTLPGTYYVWAVATDNTGITAVSPTVEVVVRRNNPVLENTAFILQTYQDIANTATINPLVFDQLDEQLANGTLTRADIIVSDLTANGGVALTELAGFQAPVNLLATYYVLMGQWPTPQNYTNFLATARFNLPAAVAQILNANEYFAKYGFVPTTQLLDNPTSAVTAEAFLNRLHVSAGIRPPEPLDRVTFRSNNALSPTRGRGYAVVGLQQAITEFVTNTNSTNTALFAKARAAALFYQLTRPPVTVTVDEITARIDALLRLPTPTAIAEAVLKDQLYGYRFITITRQPQSVIVTPRSGVIFSVEAQGAPPLVYQWLLNGATIAGATNSVLSLTNVDVGRVGNYTVAITSAAATETSDVATLTLATTPAKLANISTRGVTSGGENVLIGGFVVAGANAQQTRQMLIRAVGPTLSGAPFNVSGVLANPRLEVYAGNGANPVITNDDWGTQAGGAAQVNAIQQTTTRVAAFNLPANSLDSVVLATLPPGPYTVQAKPPAATPNASGVTLIEVYDVTPNGTLAAGKATNVSTRGTVGTGGNILIAGFVIDGPVSRRMLIRGAGPALGRLGVSGVLADPQLTLVSQSTGRTIKTNDDWATGEDAAVIASAATAAGAFAFPSGSKDAAMIVMLAPGAYTVQLSGVNNGTGVAIVEVYDVDP